MKRTHTLLSLCILSGMAVLISSPARAQLVRQRITVGVHEDTSLPTAAQVDAAFADADDRLSSDTYSGSLGQDTDFPCWIEISRSGSVRRFSAGDDDVNTQGEFYEIIDESPFYMNVVDTITWCGKTGVFAGCAPTNAESGFVVTRAGLVGATGGVIVAHEFGHSVGLPHTALVQNVMRATADVNNEFINRWQCGVYRETVDGVITGNMGVELASSLDRLPIEQLAVRGFIDTVPVEVEDLYGEDDVEILKQMLFDPDQRAHHATVASLIGLISDGSDDDALALMQYVESKRANDASETGAFIGLGYLSERTDNRRALDYLIEQSEKRRWKRAIGPVLGLGLSSSLHAQSKLNELQRRARDPKRGLLKQAIGDHLKIRSLGLRGYYGRD